MLCGPTGNDVLTDKTFYPGTYYSGCTVLMFVTILSISDAQFNFVALAGSVTYKNLSNVCHKMRYGRSSQQLYLPESQLS